VRYCYLLILVLSLGACVAKDEVRYIPQNQVDYFSYQRGSYWIMQDSLTGRVDTFRVLRNERRLVKDDYNEQWEMIGVDVGQYHAASPADSALWTIGLSPAAAPTLQHMNYGLNIKSSFAQFARLPLLVNTPTLSLHGQVYTNVTLHSMGQSAMSTGNPVFIPAFYFNKSAGLLKIRMRTGDSTRIWEAMKAVRL
jgi:hypothetical protein